MLPNRQQRRFIARALRRAGLSLTIVVSTWLATALVLIVRDVPPAAAVPPMLFLAAGLLLIGFPLLAVDMIRDLGPFPRQPRRHRRSWRQRRQLARVRRRLLAARDRTHHAHRIEMLQEKMESMERHRALSTHTLSTPLDRLDHTQIEFISSAEPRVRAAFERDYHRLLGRIRTSDTTILDTRQLTSASRLLLLPTLLAGDERRRLEHLDLDRSDMNARCYVFAAVDRAIDIERWQRQLPQIDMLLGGRFRIEPRDGVSLVLCPLPEIPQEFPLDHASMRADALYLGRDLLSGDNHFLPFTALTHTLVVGPTGMGKSSLMHALAVQLAASTAIEAVHLVDLKRGIEFSGYAGCAQHVAVVERYRDLAPLLASLAKLTDVRIDAAKASGKREWHGAPIILIVDEFARIMTETDTNDGRKAVIDGFVQLGNQARAAGIFLWIQVQHAVADTLPTALRRNLTATISFRQPSAQAAAQIFGDTGDLPLDITKLQRGQFIYRNGRTSDTHALQAPYVRPEDISALIPRSAP